MPGLDHLTSTPLTSAEAKILALLSSLPDQVVSRDQIALALWGPNWTTHYSESVIDTLIHRIRRKLTPESTLKTLRNRGFIFHQRHQLPIIKDDPQSLISPPTQILPPTEYLKYMNDPQSNRKILKDLFKAMDTEKISLSLSAQPTILVIDSHSFDNVDALAAWAPAATQAYFTSYDERALAIHRDRISELSLQNYHVLYDDIRASNFKSSVFDLVINDFRLNFNINDLQNRQALTHMFHILKPGGMAIISTVVDYHYESPRFGDDQQKAPLNTHNPAKFMADERLERYCFTVPYYLKTFSATGFNLIQEFDLKEGKSWLHTFTLPSPFPGPSFRRFLLQKPA